MKSYRSFLMIFAVVITCLALTSCEEDDSLTPNPQFDPALDPNSTVVITSQSLVGTWEMTSLDYAGSSTVTQGGQSFTSNFTGVGTSFSYEITFNDNPKTYSTTGGYTVELTSFIDTTSITQTVALNNLDASGTWNLNGNTLSLTDSTTNETSSAEILRANNNTFAQDFSGTSGPSQGGANVNITSGEIVFQRKP